MEEAAVDKNIEQKIVDQNRMNKIVLRFDYLPCLNYSALSCGVSTCSSFIIENHDEKDWLHVKVSIKGELIKENISHIEIIRQGKSFQLQTIEIAPDINALISLTEAVKTSFFLIIENESEVLWEKEYPISLGAGVIFRG